MSLFTGRASCIEGVVGAQALVSRALGEWRHVSAEHGFVCIRALTCSFFLSSPIRRFLISSLQRTIQGLSMEYHEWLIGVLAQLARKWDRCEFTLKQPMGSRIDSRSPQLNLRRTRAVSGLSMPSTALSSHSSLRHISLCSYPLPRVT